MKAFSSLLFLFCFSSLAFAQQKKIALVFNCESYLESGLNIDHKNSFILDFQKYLVAQDYDIQIINNPLGEEMYFELNRVKQYYLKNNFPDGTRLDVFFFGRAFSRLGKSYILPRDFDSEDALKSSVELSEIETLLFDVQADEINLCFDLIDGGAHSSSFLYRWALAENLNHLKSNIRFSLAKQTYHSSFFSIQESITAMPIKIFLTKERQLEIKEEDPYKRKVLVKESDN